MDSQLTLVDPHIAALAQGDEGGVVLLFQGSSMLNNVLHLRGSENNFPAYIIQSNRTASQTEIRRVVRGGVELGPTNSRSTITSTALASNSALGEDNGFAGGQVVVISRIFRNDVLPDVVEFVGIHSLQRKKWLKHKRFFDPRFTSTDENKIYFVWGRVDRRQLALYSEASNEIIARFWTHIPGVEPAKLVLTRPDAEIMFEAVITSLILVEQKYRVMEKI
ncbi:hypothetical protein ABKN59_007827 [Abortiporus biennis]